MAAAQQREKLSFGFPIIPRLSIIPTPNTYFARLGEVLRLFHCRCIWAVVQIAIVHIRHSTFNLFSLQELTTSEHLSNLPAVAVGVHNLERNAIAISSYQTLKAGDRFLCLICLLQDKPALVTEIVTDAKVRLTKRKQAGMVRRTIAMVQKYGS